MTPTFAYCCLACITSVLWETSTPFPPTRSGIAEMIRHRGGMDKLGLNGLLANLNTT
jgi:hypothetical protein